MGHKQTYFNRLWLSDPKFHWTQEAESRTCCYCKYCKKSFDLSNMEKSALVSHQAGKKHKECIATPPVGIPNYFASKANDKGKFKYPDQHSISRL